MRGTVIVNDGIQLLVKLAASGKELEFSRVAVGTGQVPSGYDPQSMKNLNAYKMDGIIASCSADGDTATIVSQISSAGVEVGFTVTEAGIFAIDPDKGEVLYSYLDMSGDPQYLYADGSTITKFIELTLNVVIGSAANVTAYINPNSMIKRQEFETELGKKADSSGGDISNTVIGEVDELTEEFPVPTVGESTKTFFGKMKKFVEDFRNWCTGVLTIGMIVNNAVTDNSGLPVSAAVAKALQDQVTQL